MTAGNPKMSKNFFFFMSYMGPSATPGPRATPPPPVPTSAKKRKPIVTDTKEDCDVPAEDKSYVLLEKNYLKDILKEVVCGVCFGKLEITFVEKNLDCKIDVQCENCVSETKSEVSETPVTNMMVYSCMKTGLGIEGFHNFVGTMSLKPLGNKYTKYSREVIEAHVENTASIF